MKLVREIMTCGARCVAPETSLAAAAQLMADLHVGALPVCDRNGLVGMLTDRDVAVRAVSLGANPRKTTVHEAMNREVVYVWEDATVSEAARLFEITKIRRLPVLNREKRLVGILSLGDLLITADAYVEDAVLNDVSESLQVHTV